MPTRRHAPRLTRAAVLCLPAILITACGGSSVPGSSLPTPGAQANIISEIPSAVKAMEPFQIASDASYAPNEYVNATTGNLVGWDLELAQDVCAVLGQTCTITNVTFDDIIPALTEAHPKYVMSFSSYTPNATREQVGIDFITYYQAGESWLVKKGSPMITQASQMCGHSVAVESGTVEEQDAWGYMGKKPGGDTISGDPDNCTAAGLQDIDVESFAEQTEANTALLSGRADFGWADQPVADYQVEQNPTKLEISGQPCSVYPYGIAVKKSLGFDKALEDAVTYVIQHGFYTPILKAYGVEDGAIPASGVNVNDNNAAGATCVPAY